MEKGKEMKVKRIDPEILVLEYRQDKDNKDYGSCLWADFYFNLDSYDLAILSDVGNYGYAYWSATSSESFLELMARISKSYLLEKLCGEQKDFDYEATKERFYEYYGEESEDRAKLDEIFEEIECEFEPTSGDAFLKMFDDLNVDNHNHAIFCDTFEMPVYDYTPWQKRICTIFRDYIQPEIRRLVKEAKEFMEG